MFKLLKFAIYGMIGYGIYQLYRAVQCGQLQLPQPGRPSSRGSESPSHRSNITGPGQGTPETTADPSGGTGATHYVGRGVVL